ncbi:MAG: hypothetical protein D6746_06100 [Bacteroidetes bacterium]|nr:MAG: hypothetical protein D6746_06100 [Bacteroidota bacterium]
MREIGEYNPIDLAFGNMVSPPAEPGSRATRCHMSERREKLVVAAVSILGAAAFWLGMAWLLYVPEAWQVDCEPDHVRWIEVYDSEDVEFTFVNHRRLVVPVSNIRLDSMLVGRSVEIIEYRHRPANDWWRTEQHVIAVSPSRYNYITRELRRHQ